MAWQEVLQGILDKIASYKQVAQQTLSGSIDPSNLSSMKGSTGAVNTRMGGTQQTGQPQTSPGSDGGGAMGWLSGLMGGGAQQRDEPSMHSSMIGNMGIKGGLRDMRQPQDNQRSQLFRPRRWR